MVGLLTAFGIKQPTEGVMRRVKRQPHDGYEQRATLRAAFRPADAMDLLASHTHPEVSTRRSTLRRRDARAVALIAAPSAMPAVA